ncbi:MAG TPA: transposase [Nitrosomonas nitrosa]|nr:transposase [Nitrosomonas nitrosa]
MNLLERRLDLLVRHIDKLREAVRATKRDRPFHIDAWVVLPDHMHTIWTLPPDDDDFSNRWKSIKIRFVQKLPRTERRSKVRVAKGERGIWQRRYWEHRVRDERDYANHVAYIHYNPVKHGYVSRVIDWPYSSFHRHVRSGRLDNPVSWVTRNPVSWVICRLVVRDEPQHKQSHTQHKRCNNHTLTGYRLSSMGLE